MLSEIKDSSDHILSGKYLVRQTEHQEASFTLLEATYLERTGLRFEPSDYVSFGLADKNGFLTNAGKLMTDQHTVYNSRMFCTRWNGLEKGSIFDDALDDKEYEGNLIYLLKSGSEFIRNNSKVRFVKEAQYRVDKPDYAERAVTEALVNALIHRDYIVLGSEVHIDMFDDRVEITSPGGMFGGGSIQEYDIYSIRSMRRNPVIADLFHCMKYMERRGSGLRKIVSETEKLPGYTEAYKPEFSSTATDFRVILKNVNYNLEGNSHQVTHQVTHQVNKLTMVSEQILAFCTKRKNVNTSLEEEIQELKDVLDLNRTLTEYTPINATILSRNKSYWFNQIMIDKGSKDGIKKDMAVVTKNGLIGKISRVYPHSSEIKLITSDDVNYKVSVTIKTGNGDSYAI